MNIQLPNGKVLEGVPDGTTKTQVLSFLKRRDFDSYKSLLATMKGTDTAAESMSGTERFAAGAGKAVIDAKRGIEQLVRSAVPGVSAEEKALQSEINESRSLDAPLMETGAGLAGNIAGNVGLFAPTAMVPGANTYTGAALTGALLGNMQPVAEGESRALNTGAGLLGGAAGRAITGGISRMLSPQTSQGVTALQREGVRVTPGGILGGAAKSAEDKLISVPILGDAIRSAQTRGIKDFNKAAINRALAPIGQKASAIGRKGVEEAQRKISNAYGRTLSGITAKADQQFMKEVQGLSSLTTGLRGDVREQFSDIVKREVGRKFTSAGRMSGDAFKQVDERLGQIARGAMKADDYNQRELGKAVLELQGTMRRMVERSNPDKAPALKAANEAYANLLRVERAASMVGAEDGVFTPAQLRSAVKALDPSRNKRGFAQGNALMQDLAEAGQASLPSKVPNSGTTDRALLAGLAGGAAYIDPLIPTGLLGAAAGYTRPAQALASGLLTARPQAARAAGDLIGRGGGLGGIAGSGLLTGYPRQ